MADLSPAVKFHLELTKVSMTMVIASGAGWYSVRDEGTVEMLGISGVDLGLLLMIITIGFFLIFLYFIIFSLVLCVKNK